ncbi:DNA damage response protein [Schizosaccharomyces japonicus yFS275]|uniref:DNA damage response protein n=1 Tax=Schizosaccharomyces japonicus (strain yFS275 / FY16936) TaxID=402676 RepID=B6JVF9_SCHJY|nr:DNA damage response protein [Schizosaccharomyces japonicus yFS275]EEB05360.1 DNA damage response protein [Schizosaccharomyces japonicus yFS275]
MSDLDEKDADKEVEEHDEVTEDGNSLSPVAKALSQVEVPKTARRVKVYEMEFDNWADCGTGYCSGLIEDSLAFLIVHSEIDNETVLLKTQIINEDIYSRQEDTLIVWQELDGSDMALSFQEAVGCIEMWTFLVDVQKAISTVTGKPIKEDSLLDEAALAQHNLSESMVLPAAELSNFAEINEFVLCAMQSLTTREALRKLIVSDHYAERLLELFSLCEDLENTQDLYLLCSIFKSFIQLNDDAFFEPLIRNDETLLALAGVFEYDPEFPNFKAKHREYLMDNSRFKEVVPIRDPEVLKKIHQTFKLQYLRDVIFSRVLDDPTFCVLNSFIFFNQADIIKHLQHDDVFLNELFGLYSNPDENDQRKQDGILLIQQICQIAQSLQSQSCGVLYTEFVKRNLFSALDYAMKHENPVVRNTGSDILISIIDQNPSLIWKEFENDVAKFEDENTVDAEMQNTPSQNAQQSMLTSLISMLHHESSLGVLAQMTEAFKALLSCPGSYGNENISRAYDMVNETNIENGLHFIDVFYQKFLDKLVQPLLQLEDPEAIGDEQLNVLSNICELVGFCMRSHENWLHKRETFSGLSRSVAKLLHCTKKHVQLTALRFFRTGVGAHWDTMISLMLENHSFDAIFELMLSVRTGSNLVTSACLEFFEFVKNEGTMPVLLFLYSNYQDKLSVLQSLHTFADLINTVQSYQQSQRQTTENLDNTENNQEVAKNDISTEASISETKDKEPSADENAFTEAEDTHLSEKTVISESLTLQSEFVGDSIDGQEQHIENTEEENGLSDDEASPKKRQAREQVSQATEAKFDVNGLADLEDSKGLLSLPATNEITDDITPESVPDATPKEENTHQETSSPAS